MKDEILNKGHRDVLGVQTKGQNGLFYGQNIRVKRDRPSALSWKKRISWKTFMEMDGVLHPIGKAYMYAAKETEDGIFA